MTIRDPEKFCAALWDWGFLDGCFGGTKIRVTDVDGFVERNGHYLVIEAKSSGASIPFGQAIMFRQMQAGKRHTVILLWGTPPIPEFIQVFGPKGTTQIMPSSQEHLQKWVSNWFEYADGMKGKAA